MIRAEERFEAGSLGTPNDRQLILVRETHLGLDHQREPHRQAPFDCVESCDARHPDYWG
jgi:hypothetical protein